VGFFARLLHPVFYHPNGKTAKNGRHKMSDNIIDLATEAQKKGKFSLADAIKGRAFPESSVDVYVDAASAFEFKTVQESAAELKPDSPEHEAALVQMEELSDKIKSSRLTFHMRGVGQGAVEEITQKAEELYPQIEGSDDPSWIKYYLSALIASNITRVTDQEGNEDDSTFTAEDVMILRDIMPIDSWEVLIDTMQKLTLASSYFDAVTDAGFLPKS
tara:strand:- start:5879 stop:6529 length:651 start_codon:yes stop_codon:yes gene_type:complete